MFARTSFFLLFLIADLSRSVVATAGDKPAWKANTWVIEATAFSGSVQYHRGVIPSLRFGFGVAAGPIQGVTINSVASEDFSGAREIASAGFLISCRFGKSIAAEASPLRVSLYGGDDWSQFYPSGHVKAILVFPNVSAPRLGFGTQLTLIRVAGPNGSGDYPLYWLPVLVALHF